MPLQNNNRLSRTSNPPDAGEPATPVTVSEEPRGVQLPPYLVRTYWWAYLHPVGIRVFERQWLVNLILWGNFRRLRDAAVQEIGTGPGSRVLQVACVYGNFSEHVLERVGSGSRLDVVDVAPAQLKNLDRKLPPSPNLHLHLQDSTHLLFEDASFDTVILFFLLHEQPAEAKRESLGQALRVLKPGGAWWSWTTTRRRISTPCAT